MSVHVSFASQLERDGQQLCKFIGSEDGVKECLVWTIPLRFAEQLRDAINFCLSITLGFNGHGPKD